VDSLIAQREEARKSGHFDLADMIRDKIAALGVQIVDTPAGPRWRRD
jgi:cysteinyl-tRNA synthetase